MKKTRLGRTNLEVTGLGWGGIPIQRVNKADAVSLIRAVIGMGVDLLDTARAYTDSEEKIGLALQGINKPIVLSSKSMNRTEAIYDDVHISLKNLKVKKINIYNLHNIAKKEDYEKVMAPGGAYHGLKRAQKEGLIDFIGVTSHSLDMLEKIIQDNFFDCIMLCYSFLEPDAAKKIIPEAIKKDIGIMTMKPFSGGIIDRAEPAIKYVLQTSGIVPIPGSESIEKAQKNWNAFAGNGELTDEDKLYIENLRKQTEKNFCHRCDYCLPCPEGINIQYAVGLKQTLTRFGTGAKWLMAHVENGRKCVECGICLSRCPYGLPIPDLIKKNLAWFDEKVKLNAFDVK